MSMPLYLEVAVVATDESSFDLIRDIPAISKTGIAPRYMLAALRFPKDHDVIPFDDLTERSIGYWIALDDNAVTSSPNLRQDLPIAEASTIHIFQLLSFW